MSMVGKVSIYLHSSHAVELTRGLILITGGCGADLQASRSSILPGLHNGAMFLGDAIATSTRTTIVVRVKIRDHEAALKT